MSYAAIKTLHVLAMVLWVGGMAFAHFFLRPAVTMLSPPERLKLMREVLRRFFTAVTAAVVVLLASGFMLLGHSTGGAGRSVPWPIDWIVMVVLGLVMVVVYGVVRIVYFSRFERALDGGDLPAAAAVLARIRACVAFNLALGIAIIVAMTML
jgi:uncharacterized membrane protein